MSWRNRRAGVMNSTDYHNNGEEEEEEEGGEMKVMNLSRGSASGSVGGSGRGRGRRMVGGPVVGRQMRNGLSSSSSSEAEEIERESESESVVRSCLSSEESLKYSSSPETEATSSMVLVGCPRCLMYVMLSQADPRCPKCKSTVLLDFLRNNHNTPR